jgi:hypothetical protein
MTTTTLTVRVPGIAEDMAAVQHEAETLARTFASCAIDSPEEYALIDTTLSDTARKLDAVVAMRKRGTAPLYTATREIEGWFRPTIRAYEHVIATFKAALGAYRVALASAEAEARAIAQRAAEAGDADTLCAALELADDAHEPPAGRATCTFEWCVQRIAEDLLLDEYWIPDRARIDAEAKAWGGGESPPVISGVIFERVARIGARR